MTFTETVVSAYLQSVTMRAVLIDVPSYSILHVLPSVCCDILICLSCSNRLGIGDHWI